MSTRTVARSALLLALLCLSVVVTGCERERAKKAAKERVFAQPPPDPFASLAKEDIAVDKLATRAELQERLNAMSFAEIAYRVRAATFDGELKLRMARGNEVKTSVEKAHIEQGPAGAFRLDVSMLRGDEQHIVFADDTLYVRHNFGRWRTSRDPTDERLHWREQAYRLWPSVYQLFKASLRFSEPKPVTHRGRAALRFDLRVEPSAAAMPMQPALLRDDNDKDDKQRDLRLAQRAEQWRQALATKSGAGHIIVDDKTGVVLEARLNAEASIEDEPENAAQLTVELNARFSDIGVDPKIIPPADSIEEFSRRKIVTHPLGFLDAGAGPTPAPTKSEEEP